MYEFYALGALAAIFFYFMFNSVYKDSGEKTPSDIKTKE